jgi:hypothetical protein
MTRKHFVQMAAIIRQTLTDNRHSPAVARARAMETANAFMQLALASNPRFDSERFLRACGLQAETP